MIRIEEIKICGQSDAGAFEGSFAFKEGLQIVSANNRFGKSLAVTSIAWCLGLEPMYGLQDNDPARFPTAVRDVIDLDGTFNVPVRSSCSILSGHGKRAKALSYRCMFNWGQLKVSVPSKSRAG
jgi:hypothetical protein